MSRKLLRRPEWNPQKKLGFSAAQDVHNLSGSSPAVTLGGNVSNILLVEDDEQTCQKLAPVIARAGHTVHIANDGASALARMRSVPTALVLLDMVMPEMDGWKFLQEKRRDPHLQSVPVIIMTGIGVASSEWAKALGAVDFVRKPFEIERLLTSVDQQLETCRAAH